MPWRASPAARSLFGLRVKPRKWNPVACSACATAPPCLPVTPVMRIVRSLVMAETSSFAPQYSSRDAVVCTLRLALHGTPEGAPSEACHLRVSDGCFDIREHAELREDHRSRGVAVDRLDLAVHETEGVTVRRG